VPRPLAPAAVALALLGAVACGTDAPTGDAADLQDAAEATTPGPAEAGTGDLTASFLDAGGAETGTVEITFDDRGATFVVEASGLEPGFHGLHVHETGSCEPQSASPTNPAMVGDFLSAGGHLSSGGQAHSDHLGDLPSLLVLEDGTATLTVTTDRLAEQDVLDADGSALMVHAGPDNFGNIPERYAPQGPDEMTDGTGDSGGRIACAVLTG
jgi:Cu-Zn family superoxide dismutase